MPRTVNSVSCPRCNRNTCSKVERTEHRQHFDGQRLRTYTIRTRHCGECGKTYLSIELPWNGKFPTTAIDSNGGCSHPSPGM